VLQLPPLLPGQSLPQVGWFAILSDSAGFIDEAYVIAVAAAVPPLGPMLTLDHAVMFVGSANLLASQNPPPDHKELNVVVSYPPPNVAPYSILQLPLLSAQDPLPQIGQWAYLWSNPASGAAAFIDKALIIAVSAGPYTPANPLLVTLDHAVSFVGSARLKSGPRRTSSPRSPQGQGCEQKIVIELDDCKPSRHSHPRGCQCDGCLRIVIEECQDKIKCKQLDAGKCCLREACIDRLTVNHLSAPSFSECNLLRAAVSSVAYNYTLGQPLSWATVQDDPSAMFSSLNGSFTVPAAGYWEASIFLNLANLAGVVNLAGVPVANAALQVNGVPRVQTYVPFLTFSTRQASSLASTLLLQAGDVVNATFNVQYVDPVSGEVQYVGTMGVSPPSFFTLVQLASLCSSKGQKCECHHNS
jgi:hypothetical protein